MSVALEGWSHSRAIAEYADTHVVTHHRNRENFQLAGLDEAQFTCLDLQDVEQWMTRCVKLLKCEIGGAGQTTYTALSALTYYRFEQLLWRQFGARIRRGDFDLVHRLTPLSPTVPSIIAGRCKQAGIPYVIGPLNGGLPWPAGFDRTRAREREWLSYVRDVYKLLPGYRSTRKNAAAIICGSRDTQAQIATAYHDRCVYIPENAIDPTRFDKTVDGPVRLPLKVAFVGRLVPYKCADVLIEAAAPLVRDGKLVLDIIGGGFEMASLQTQVRRLGVEHGVQFAGRIPHQELKDRLTQSDVFGFPSVREFGGAVVLEAMALGLVPVVMAYGGPGELVTPSTGFALPMGSRAENTQAFRQTFERLIADPSVIRPTGERARRRVMEHFTWDAKARQTLEVYRWVLGERDKPEFAAL